MMHYNETSQALTVSKAVPSKFVKPLAWVLLGSVMLALFSQIAIPVPFSNIRFTMQTFAVLMLGTLMGKKYGTLSVVAYLFQGSCGLPVFAGATCNSFWYAGVSGGYLFGFVAAAWLVGALCEKWTKTSLKRLIVANSCAAFVILFCGWAWLSAIMGATNAFYVGVLPFIFGDIVKAVSAAFIAKGYIDFRKPKAK